jgi:hypothetical protein
MVSIPSLWLPILVSAIIVFLASWILHMFLPYHRSDFQKVPSEDECRGRCANSTSLPAIT